MMSRGRFGARAVRRLRIAAALMRVHIGGDPTQAQCEQLLRRIDALSAQARERLRGCVDWVEAYERAESEAMNTASCTSGYPQKRWTRQWRSCG